MTKGKKGLSEIVFILDESGSMHGTVSDTIGGFNQFIQDQREMPGEAKFTLVKFSASYGVFGGKNEENKGYEIVHDGVKLADVPELTDKTYGPRGATALLDAVGNAVSAVTGRHAKAKKSEKPEKVIFAVLTDGEENSSREYGARAIKKMVKAQEKKGWTFLFLGADINAWAEGIKFGFGKMSVSVDKASMGSTFSKMSYYTGTVRSDSVVASLDTFDLSDKEVEEKLDDLKKEGS